MPGDATFLEALVTALRADIGAGSLVALTEHTSSDKRIVRGRPPKGGKLPFLGVCEFPSTPLIKEHTFVKRYLVSIIAFAGKDINAILISDRVEILFHKMGEENNSYFDFTNEDVTVYSALWKGRVKAKKDDDLDCYADENLIEIICNPFQGIS